MMIYYWIVLAVGLPVLAVALNRTAADNPLGGYLRPRLLSGTEHTKSELRQAGVAWIVWSAWLISIPIALISRVPFKQFESSRIILAAMFFVLPVTVAVLQIVGWLYLLQGLLGRTTQATPIVQSMFAADENKLEIYIGRMWHYARLSMTALALTIVVPVTEAYFEVEPTGPVVLVNVFFLISFIMTLWRARVYVVKSCVVLSRSGQEVLFSMLGGPASILHVWRNAYCVRQQYLQREYREMKRPSSRDSVARPTH
ncbi:hypothetical protein C3F09_06545 [candidate division GN15 bacterium]|uniref:Uncharacterized protein n=1 Tax=candidate division GN15 bacterium TaxID=2072418 RepID=A0A855X1L5_9BACT|nr:MAG: hypothetical protein C3F09_06545 [candidate division GN15 bacterium]